jgi:hypothetical protein
MKPHDVTDLPKWVKTKIANLEEKLRETEAELDRTRAAHGILFEREHWFAIQGPPENSVRPGDIYNLFYLSRDGATTACLLAVGDVLLVGRKKR